MAALVCENILILDDDQDAAAFIRSEVEARFPTAQVGVRDDADLESLSVPPPDDGRLWACIFDDDFGGTKLATRVAVALQSAQPECHLIAVSGCFTAAKRAVLLALGCASACDKCDPAQLTRALDSLQERR